MKAIVQKRNVKATVPLPKKESLKKELAIKHPPTLKPKNKRAK